MPISDYAHWNEEAPIIWWQEEGKHDDQPDYHSLDDDGYYEDHPPEGME
jgi:hypothetical protein